MYIFHWLVYGCALHTYGGIFGISTSMRLMYLYSYTYKRTYSTMYYIFVKWKSIVTNLLVEYGLRLPIQMKMQSDIRVFNAIENVQVKLKLKFSEFFFYIFVRRFGMGWGYYSLIVIVRQWHRKHSNHQIHFTFHPIWCFCSNAKYAYECSLL